MPQVKDIARAIERIAPLMLQEDYDNAGLQVGDPDAEVGAVLVALDVTEETVAEAYALTAQRALGEAKGAQGVTMIVSHHPLIFRPLRRLTPGDYVGRTVLAAVRAGVALYAAHTNLDNAPGGVNSRMADVLGLTDVTPLVPLPAQRTAGLPADMAARCGSGAVGTLPHAMPEEDFVRLVKERFGCPCIKHNRVGGAIRRVALCGGAGGSFIAQAQRSGADAYLTGEVGYHPFFGQTDLLVIEAGHYETEQYTVPLLQELLQQAFPTLDVRPTLHPARPIVVE